MKKEKSIDEIYRENEEGIQELIKQLKLAGVKNKTIKTMLKDINDYQNELYKKAMISAFEKMKGTIAKSIFAEDFLDENIK